MSNTTNKRTNQTNVVTLTENNAPQPRDRTAARSFQRQRPLLRGGKRLQQRQDAHIGGRVSKARQRTLHQGKGQALVEPRHAALVPQGFQGR